MDFGGGSDDDALDDETFGGGSGIDGTNDSPSDTCYILLITACRLRAIFFENCGDTLGVPLAKTVCGVLKLERLV
jgi:hypothetical protein